MIDLHMHSTYSDGTASVLDILRQAQNLGLNTISITDHETCMAHKELETINIKEYYTGNIITGIELKTQYNDRIIDVLGYNIDCDKMIKYLNECYRNLTRENIQEIQLKEFYKYAEEYKLKIRPIQDLKWDKTREWASVVFYNEIKQYEENKEKLPEDLWESFRNFRNSYYHIKGKMFYINMSKYYPTLDKIIEIIHKSGGLAFIAHIYEYSSIDNKIEELNKIADGYNIDGIECYYSTFTEEQIEYLIEFCKRRNLLISGGTDYHGENKRDIKMGIGKGNLEVPDSILSNWKNDSGDKGYKNMLKNKEVIIFDLDGTLLDSVNMFNNIYSIFIKKVSKNIISTDQIQEDWDTFTNQNKEGDLYDNFLIYLDNKYGSETHDIDFIKRVYNEIEYKYITEEIKYKKFAKEIVAKLKELGYTLVLATLSPKYIIDIYNNVNKNLIKDFKIYDTFDLVLTYEDVQNRKPNPEIYLTTVDRLNVSKEKCLIIEDSLEGMKAANSSGIEVLNIVDENMYKTQKVIDTLSTYKMNNLKEFLELL